MLRYNVSFWSANVFLGYVTVWADSPIEAEEKARSSRSHRGWDNGEYSVIIEKV